MRSQSLWRPVSPPLDKLLESITPTVDLRFGVDQAPRPSTRKSMLSEMTLSLTPAVALVTSSSAHQPQGCLTPSALPW